MQRSIILLTLLVAILTLSLVLNGGGFALAKSKDSKAKDAIIKAIGREVEGKYSKVVIVAVSKKDNSSNFVVVYNKTGGAPSPGPTPTPEPPPPVVLDGKSLCVAGDIKGTAVALAMTAEKCGMKIALGDLGYQDDLAAFKKLGFDKCVIGNHDSTEDGNKAILAEAIAYCGESWSMKVTNTTMIIGFNSNGNLDKQLGTLQNVVMNPDNMIGTKNVIIMSHKPSHTSPNSHHPVESDVRTFYDSLEAKIPNNIRVIEVTGHNHQMAASADGNWVVSGAGGKSHYECGKDAVWTFCNNSVYGFAKFIIAPSGEIGMQFINTEGSVVTK